MSVSFEEEALLKQCVQEITDGKYLPQLRELEKKLSTERTRLKELEAQVDRYGKELEQHRQCNKCNKEMFDRRDAFTQTPEPTCDKKQYSPQFVAPSPPHQPQVVRYPPASDNLKKPSTPSSKQLSSSSKQQIPKATSKTPQPSTSKQPGDGVFRHPLPAPPQAPTKQTSSTPKNSSPSTSEQACSSTSKQDDTSMDEDTPILDTWTQTSRGNISKVKKEMEMTSCIPNLIQEEFDTDGRESVDSMEVENGPEIIDLTIDSD